MFCHASKEKHGFQWWWHFGSGTAKHRCLGIEFSWWARFCHAYAEVNDEGWKWSIALPPFAFWITFDGFPAWKPRKKHVAAWDGGREFWLVDRRECGIHIHSWTIDVKPWAKSDEWCRSDPWWTRGVSLDIPDLLLGRSRCTTEVLREGIPVTIPMPEGMYSGVARIERRTWKRPRWFAHSRVSTWLEIPKGIPHAGKGENSWDCGDDGLFGIGAEGDDVMAVILRARESVLVSRRRYGSASDKAIQEALA